MSLPKEKKQRETDPSRFTVLLYGEPKIGKSTACARIEGALFIPTEAGLKNLSVYATDIVETWGDFLDIAKEVSEGNHQFKTIVIDTVDGLYRLCAKHVCAKNSWVHESMVDFGKAHIQIVVEMLRVLNKLANLPTGLVLVGHSKTKEVKERTATFDRVSLTLSNSIEHAIISFVDVCLYCTSVVKDGNHTRIVRSKHAKDYLAGGRIDLFEDGMLLEDLFKTDKIKGGSK